MPAALLAEARGNGDMAMKRVAWKQGSRLGSIMGWALAAALAAGICTAAASQGAGQGQNRAVRLSIVEGQVRLSHLSASGSEHPLTDDAVANTPLFQGTGIQTGDDGRAEIQFEDGSIARIPPDSALTLSVLKPGQTELALNSGLGYFELKSAGDSTTGPIKVRFGSAAAVATGSAVFRIKLDEAPGEVAVFDGSLHIDGQSGAAADLHGGESAKLDSFSVAESIEPDSWDAWNSDRDQALNAAAGSTTVATSGMPQSANPAWGDLNQSGNWYDVPGEGSVWSPYEASDSSWDPYGDGYWMNTPGYGYTWVSGESWGYMPYQCGMWNWYGGFGWGWAPGGCSPWWGAGGLWAINVGRGPFGWRAPVRPPRPRGIGGPQPGGSVARVGPAPIISVRRQGPPVDGVLPLRDRKTPVTIAGATIVPMRPVISRPVYNHQLPAQPGRFQVGGAPSQQPGQGGRPGYTPALGSSSGPSGSSHIRVAPGGARSAPAVHSAPPPAPRSSPPPPPPAPAGHR
jgi:hypothetical protein